MHYDFDKRYVHIYFDILQVLSIQEWNWNLLYEFSSDIFYFFLNHQKNICEIFPQKIMLSKEIKCTYTCKYKSHDSI